MHFPKIKLTLLFILFLGFTTCASAQQIGTIQGTVVDMQKNQSLAGVNIIIKNTSKGTTTNTEGDFRISNVPVGLHTLIFSFTGFKKLSKTISVSKGQTQKLAVELLPSSTLMDGIKVTALQPNQITEAQLKEADVQEANPRDSGELLRNVKGVDAARRGPIGLDPVIRGLRETEIGTYLDGTRIFPGGAARMDSPLSHLDPSAIETIEVVKGPYALSWGAGNMSAVRVETQPLNTLTQSFSGTISSGYDSNFNAVEESASLRGTTGKFGYWLHGAWREGNNYKSGNGANIPGDFLSREIRGKLSYAISSNSYVNLSIGYQNQEDLDYPGRLLNADYFDTYNYAFNWEWTPNHSMFSSLKANAYLNKVDHGMSNNSKPTAEPDPNRMPPFALDVRVESQAHVRGGKFSAELDPSSSWNLKIGTDIYSVIRDATRYIRRQDNGNLLFMDLMWPDATITDVGLYAKANHSFTDRLSATGTLRFDFVTADADTSSSFFRNNVSSDLNKTESNLSGSFTLTYIPEEHWTLGAGLGSVVRTADASEQYSDRIPASKAQTSAEFVGNPALNPERSTQSDLWIDANYSSWNVSLNLFARQIDNYITLTPTNLSKRLPLSPSTVYQYVNGKANFWGFDVSSSYQLMDPLSLHAGVNYLFGKDISLNEPALGVPPFSINSGLRYESPHLPWFIESTVHWVGKQDRIAATRGEIPTEDYITADLQGGITFWQQFSIQAGIKNITDKNYVNHLNAKNPFSGRQIPEPGRVFHVDASFQF